ncbi:TPA: hypothetical protein DDW35_10015, partial [Candidatus Sumerlaeota bacterium]|nr:hypothetical protein [Candidatus Sumerlaeota bacterium]
ITWPLIALLFSWWRTEQPQFRNACRLIPFLLFALPLSFIVNMTQASKITPDYQEVLNLSLLQKILLAGNNIVFYIGKLLWPLKHVPFYPRWQINPTHLALYLAPTAIFITLVVLWMLRKRIGRGPFAALMFYLIGLSTILGFVPWSLMTITYTQDHYQYLACIGPFLLFSYAFDTCMLRFVPQPRWVICQTLMFLLLLPLAFIAHKHACLYNDEETLFAENYRIYPTMSDVTLNYGEGLLKNGKLQEALEM